MNDLVIEVESGNEERHHSLKIHTHTHQKISIKNVLLLFKAVYTVFFFLQRELTTTTFVCVCFLSQFLSVPYCMVGDFPLYYFLKGGVKMLSVHSSKHICNRARCTVCSSEEGSTNSYLGQSSHTAIYLVPASVRLFYVQQGRL